MGPDDPRGHYDDQVMSFTITGVLNLLTNLVVLCLPLPCLCSLQLRLYKKIVLIGVFSVGLLTCVVSGICIHSLASIDFTDITMSLPQANISSGLEPAVAVTLACVPLLRPLPGRGKFSSSGTSNYASFGGSKRNGGCETRNAAPGPISDDSSQYRLRSLSPKYDVEITVSGKTDSSGGRSSELEAEERRGITARSEWAIAEERKPGKAGRRMY